MWKEISCYWVTTNLIQSQQKWQASILLPIDPVKCVIGTEFIVFLNRFRTFHPVLEAWTDPWVLEQKNILFCINLFNVNHLITQNPCFTRPQYLPTPLDTKMMSNIYYKFGKSDIHFSEWLNWEYEVVSNLFQLLSLKLHSITMLINEPSFAYLMYRMQ